MAYPSLAALATLAMSRIMSTTQMMKRKKQSPL
jgi:hypothetical protein